jgi:2-C-methyl-D-erythritol 4-phosphate cytidylyltransferase
MKDNVTAVILAAGKGARMGIGENKSYLRLAGRPVLSYSLAAFHRHPQIDEIVLVVAEGERRQAAGLAVEMEGVKIVYGGDRRQDSALAGVREAKPGIVLIHDAARPFVSSGLITRVVAGVREHQACVPVIPEVDTLRYVDERGFIRPKSIGRACLRHVQTPQGFTTELIRSALEKEKGDVTDDAGALLGCGIGVWTVSGDRMNIKLTTKMDFALAERLACKFDAG